jgi:hypothetical protein
MQPHRPGAPPIGTPPASGRFGPHHHSGRGHSTPRTKRAHMPPVMPIVELHQQAPGVRHGGGDGAWSRLLRVSTLHDEHGAGDPGRPVTPQPPRSSTSRSEPSSPSSEGIQREEPAQVGRFHPKPPRCSPFGDANRIRDP